MRTLVATSYAPGAGSGRAARTYGIVRALLEHGPVDLMWLPCDGDRPSEAYSSLPGLVMHRVVRDRRLERILAYGRLRLRGVPAPVARGVSPELAALASGLADGADRVVADDPSAAVSLWHLAGRRPVVYSAHNLEWRFRTDWGSVAAVRAFEARLLEHVAEVWMPSRADVRDAESLAPQAAIRYAPNVVDVSRTRPTMAARRRRALLLADFTYGPNREGLRWLLDEVWPHLARDVELVVVGRGLARDEVSRPGVEVLGFVDDLSAVYESVGCALVPLLTGGGSPLKFVEALAHALPVVATPQAARGLDVVPDQHYLAATTPQEFALAVTRAIDSDESSEVGAAGRRLAETEYSIEALAARLAPSSTGGSSHATGTA